MEDTIFYKVDLNKDGYIVGFYSVFKGEPYDYEGFMPYDAADGYYKLVGGSLVVDANRKKELQNEV